MYWNKIKILFNNQILKLSYGTIFYRIYVNLSAEIFSILKVVSDLYLPNKYKWRSCNEVLLYNVCRNQCFWYLYIDLLQPNIIKNLV